jgi:F-type H+-transporting ATPase subunit epsilon
MIRLQLVTLSGKLFDDDVYQVTLPTMQGHIGVLQDHMPLVSAATNGVISIRRNERDRDDQMEFFATNGGVIEVSNNVLKVIVDEADHADNINQAEAEAAHERALQLKAEAKDELSLEHAQAMVDRTAVRLQVANLKRHHGHRR